MKTTKANYIMNTVVQYGDELLEMMRHQIGSMAYEQHKSTAKQLFDLAASLVASEVTDRRVKC